MTPRSPSLPGSVCAIAAAARRSTLKVPTRFTITVFVKAPRSCGAPCRSTVRWAQPMPAQLPARRSGRALPVASAIAAWTEASSVTSVRTNVVWPPSWAASAFPRSSCRSRTVTAAPLAARARVVASPSPEAPPVTTAATSKLFMPRRLGGRLSLYSGAQPARRVVPHPCPCGHPRSLDGSLPLHVQGRRRPCRSRQSAPHQRRKPCRSSQFLEDATVRNDERLSAKVLGLLGSGGARAGVLLLVCSMVGHVGNYLFYVLAARALSPPQFADVSAMT